eukprot:2733640-Pyramimonas_sp.AAC.1
MEQVAGRAAMHGCRPRAGLTLFWDAECPGRISLAACAGGIVHLFLDAEDGYGGAESPSRSRLGCPRGP